MDLVAARAAAAAEKEDDIIVCKLVRQANQGRFRVWQGRELWILSKHLGGALDGGAVVWFPRGCLQQMQGGVSQANTLGMSPQSGLPHNNRVGDFDPFALPVLIGLGARWSARSTVAELERTNIALQIENASYREATGQLASQISSLQAAVDSLGIQAVVDPNAKAAMDKLPDMVKSRAMGAGGPTSTPALPKAPPPGTPAAPSAPAPPANGG